MKKERRKIGELPIDEMKQEVTDFINEVRENEPVLTDSFESIESPEFSESTVDEEKKVISYRKKDGTKVEQVGLETPNIKSKEVSSNLLNVGEGINFSEEGMSKLQQDLKDSGFIGGTGDWTDVKQAYLPIPNDLAIVSITASMFPPYSESNLDGILEYWDKNGNYFKKDIEAMGIQGRSTTHFPKKNIKFDFSDFEVKFGDWVMQDSFHLKANYLDIFRGKNNIAYDYFGIIASTGRSYVHRCPWLRKDDSKYTIYGGIKNKKIDFASDARGVPAGFPVKLYFNGEYYGLYTWNLKKHRANYAMDKANTKHIHVDPDTLEAVLQGVALDWSTFEIRNPKPKKKSDGWELVNMDGNAYDGDNPTELMSEYMDDGETVNPNYDSSNQSHVKSAQTKQYIKNWLEANRVLKEAINNGTLTRELYETYYDPYWVMDYLIFANVVYDRDGINTNTQLCTWDGVKWFPMPYDLDQLFGNQYRGNYCTQSADICGKAGGLKPEPYTIPIFTLYREELNARYKYLRDCGIISEEYIVSMIKNYVNIIGSEAMKEELDRWPETPCYRTPNTNPEWEYSSGKPRPAGKYKGVYNDETQYAEGDIVVFRLGADYDEFYTCVASNGCIGIPPLTEDMLFENIPHIGGYYDSLQRTEKWLEYRFPIIDAEFGYENLPYARVKGSIEPGNLISANGTDLVDSGKSSDKVLSFSGDLTDGDILDVADDGRKASFTLISSIIDVEPRCELLTINDEASLVEDGYVYVAAHLLKTEIEEGVYSYTLKDGAETVEESGKSYLNITQLVTAASSLEPGVLSDDVFYVRAKVKSGSIDKSTFGKTILRDANIASSDIQVIS